MRKSFIAGILFLIPSVLMPSCVESSEDPPAGDPLAAGAAGAAGAADTADTADEPTAGDEAAGVAAAGSSSVTIAAALDCRAGALCLWDLENYQGRRVTFTTAGCLNLGPYGFNDHMSSWFNRHEETYVLYRNSGCQGARFSAPSRSHSSEVGPFWKNNISSICRGPNCR